MTRARLLCTLAALVGAGAVPAAELTLPSAARMTVERATELDSFDAPLGPFSDGQVPARTLEGAVTRRAWRIDTGNLTSLQVMAPLREQIEALGYDIVFECTSSACGGFDFRFAIEVLPGPNMYVNIGSYRYLTAFKGPDDDPDETLTVLTSATAASAYVQVIHTATDAATPPVTSAAPVARPDLQPPEPEAPDLLRDGFVVLSDLDFDTGTTALGPGPFASLQELADLMEARPELRIALVGHTDTVGGLEPNIDLSRARAQAVRGRLVAQYQIDPARLDAEGMGYLAPVASNLTAEGRERNRRVEAIVLNTE
ncbi:OmpA family protein [Roseobacter sinensis]|uniref:OmpA family protein n=1 Tax=Roseobacter sinensis TaxID=2931391 RepID=A0ABT3BDI2_9RHOB|nr:OmpA family protein [Roseobacter sp. WL0113]MCV3271633.1 OmpA family protein [Roseobacter sp. WL0113]